MKNNNNNLTSVSTRRNRHVDGEKISMMANEIAVTRATIEKLSMYQNKHDNMLYHIIINLMDAPNKRASDTFTVDGEVYNFTTSGYEDVLKKFDTIRHKLAERQTALDKLQDMEAAYTKLISEVLGINKEDVTIMEDDNINEKYKYIVIETDKECDANTTKEIQKALSSGNVFDIEVNSNGLTANLIGVVTTSHDKALKIVLDYLGDVIPSSFKEFYKSGVTTDLGYSKKWCVDDITITSNQGIISRLSELILIDQDCKAE